MKQKSFNSLSYSNEATDEYDLEDKPSQTNDDVALYT